MNYDFLIIGCGIVGLAIGRELREKRPDAKILIIEKEPDTACHASGRNSGVLHAGFYYTADSLKAKFTVAGNKAMRAYCQRKNIHVNSCGKIVVARDERELGQLYELESRGKKNGSNVRIISTSEASAIEPNVRSHKFALYSPDTASVNPTQVCQSLKSDLLKSGVELKFNTAYRGRVDNVATTTGGDFAAHKIINCAGLYADKIAHDFGFGLRYTILPFKGLYLKYSKNKTDIRTNIYPVPDLRNPFLGVHFTKTASGEIKIGPTATPAFWRENYAGFQNFNPLELIGICGWEAKLFLTDSFGFRRLAIEETRKYNRKYFIDLASHMVKSIDPNGFGDFTVPGIRAQLLDRKPMKLIQDFIIEADTKSVHVLNAVSPAFTCSFPFAEYVVKNFILS